MYKSKTQIIKAFDSGMLDVVSKQLKMYGKITKDKSFEVLDGTYAGFHRITDIEHHNINWTVKMHNGDVISIKRNH